MSATSNTVEPQDDDWVHDPEYCTEGPEPHDEGPDCVEGAPGSQFIAVKWSLDESKTLAEAAEKARELAVSLQALHDEGYVLEDEISDGHGIYYKPQANR